MLTTVKKYFLEPYFSFQESGYLITLYDVKKKYIYAMIFFCIKLNLYIETSQVNFIPIPSDNQPYTL